MGGWVGRGGSERLWHRPELASQLRSQGPLSTSLDVERGAWKRGCLHVASSSRVPSVYCVYVPVPVTTRPSLSAFR